MSGPRGDVRRACALLLTTGVVLTSAACAGDALAPQAQETSSAATTTTTETTTETTTAPTTTTEETTSTSSSPGELNPDDVGRRLNLDDFFNPSPYWEENRYDIADQKQVQGIATEISGCFAEEELELRLANNFQTLDFSVGQANDSMSSDQNVSVEVLANNTQVDIRSVPFNEIQEFSIPVEGVNALKIHVSLDERVASCDGGVRAVLTDITLQ